MIDMRTLSYIAVNAVSVSAFGIQLWKLRQSAEARRELVLMAWMGWSLSYLIELTYVWQINGITALKVLSGVYFLLHIMVFGAGMLQKIVDRRAH